MDPPGQAPAPGPALADSTSTSQLPCVPCVPGGKKKFDVPLHAPCPAHSVLQCKFCPREDLQDLTTMHSVPIWETQEARRRLMPLTDRVVGRLHTACAGHLRMFHPEVVAPVVAPELGRARGKAELQELLPGVTNGDLDVLEWALKPDAETVEKQSGEDKGKKDRERIAKKRAVSVRFGGRWLAGANWTKQRPSLAPPPPPPGTPLTPPKPPCPLAPPDRRRGRRPRPRPRRRRRRRQGEGAGGGGRRPRQQPRRRLWRHQRRPRWWPRPGPGRQPKWRPSRWVPPCLCRARPGRPRSRRWREGAGKRSWRRRWAACTGLEGQGGRTNGRSQLAGAE
jgi:hypothetical protein